MSKFSVTAGKLSFSVACCVSLFAATAARADDPADPAAAPQAKELSGLKRLSKDGVWIDPKRKLVVVDGEVCLRHGQLEMFACPKGTKEHEAIVAINGRPFDIHAGLLAVGAKQGTPVSFDPKYVAATGPIVDVWVLWKDSEGNPHKVRAQEWIKNTTTGKQMDENWVFAGSSFWVDEDTDERHYQADGGDFICVSNFPTAMLDLPVVSSAAAAELQFEAFADRIPNRGTMVRLVLIPRL